MKKVLIFSFVLSVAFLALGVQGVYAQEATSTVCCERTISGASCQDVPVSECDPSYRQLPTACDSTSFCKAGTCFDSTQGTCLDNTPQLVCNDNGGVWSEESPPQCSLGCCVLGDQAAYVTLVRCKYLSAQLGLEANYDSTSADESACIASVQNQDRGACVFEHEFERTCRATTRAECSGLSDSVNGSSASGEFFKDKLCSAEELGTNCGPSTKTTLIDGKDGVYFVDTCGNPANIYDASRVNDKEYWTNIKGKEVSCGFEDSNALNPSCGNCNYLLGSFGRNKDIVDVNPTYGDFICADLNCRDTSNGQGYLHGESWCVNNDAGSVDSGEASAGSRFYRHICINGEEVVEACDDFRGESCIQDDINGFSQSACRVNRWQDCTQQVDQIDCENTDRRDCIWIEGESLPAFSRNKSVSGACTPKNPPGLKFWEGEEARNMCNQGTTTCVVTFEKGLFGGKSCVGNCECLTDAWEQGKADVCTGLGDCGPVVNWIGEKGSKPGFKIEIGSPEDFGIEGE